MTFWGRCALVALPACSRHPGSYVGNEGLPVGCAPNGPTKCFWCLGAVHLRPSWGRHASSGSTRLLQPCRISGCLYTPYVQDQQISGFIVNQPQHRNYNNNIVSDFFIRHTFQDLVGYPWILGIVDLRPLRGRHAYKGLPEIGPARLLAAMLGDMGVSTLRSINTMTQFSSLFEHQTSHAACFNAQGLLYECVFDAFLFSSSYRSVGKPVSHHVVTRSTIFLLLFRFGSSYRQSFPPRCSDTTLWVHLRCPLNFSIIVSIYSKPASYRSSLDLPSIRQDFKQVGC
jgi:hypothetical protein